MAENIEQTQSQHAPLELEDQPTPRLWQTNEKNHNVSRYNTRLRFPLGHVCNACTDFESLPDDQRRLLKAIFGIHGVDFANLDGYAIVVGKGELFSWSEIRPRIESLVKKYLATREAVKDGSLCTFEGTD